MAVDPITLGLIGGAILGGTKGQKNKQKDIADFRERRNIALYAPWTGMEVPGKVEREDALSGALSGAATGAMLGSSVQSSMAKAKAAEQAQKAALENQVAAQPTPMEESIFAENANYQPELIYGMPRNYRYSLMK
jgi:hypothetical protein